MHHRSRVPTPHLSPRLRSIQWRRRPSSASAALSSSWSGWASVVITAATITHPLAWRERWQRYGEAPDIEWEEGSSCGSWGDESSDEEGYAPEPPPPTRKKPAPCSPPPPPPPPKRPAYPPAREAAPAPPRPPPPPPPKPVAPEEEDSSQGEEAPEDEDEYDQDDAHAAEAAINNHATQFYSWPPPEQQAPPIWMLPPEAVPASARSALRQAVKVILAQHGREEALQLADAQRSSSRDNERRLDCR